MKADNRDVIAKIYIASPERVEKYTSFYIEFSQYSDERVVFLLGHGFKTHMLKEDFKYSNLILRHIDKFSSKEILEMCKYHLFQAIVEVVKAQNKDLIMRIYNNIPEILSKVPSYYLEFSEYSDEQVAFLLDYGFKDYFLEGFSYNEFFVKFLYKFSIEDLRQISADGFKAIRNNVFTHGTKSDLDKMFDTNPDLFSVDIGAVISRCSDIAVQFLLDHGFKGALLDHYATYNQNASQAVFSKFSVEDIEAYIKAKPDKKWMALRFAFTMALYNQDLNY